MSKKIVLILISLGSFLAFNTSFADFVPPPNVPLGVTAIAGRTTTVTFNLTRTSNTDIIDGLTLINTPGTILTPPTGTCLKEGDPTIPCTIILSYTPTLQIPGVETPNSSFRLRVGGTGIFPSAYPLSFRVTVVAPPNITITGIQSFATGEANGPVEGGTGIIINGSGFNLLPDDFKLTFTYPGYDPVEAMLVSREGDNRITANTPASPIPAPGTGSVSVQLTTAAGVVLSLTPGTYLYEIARCQVNGNNPSECVAQLKPCITVTTALDPATIFPISINVAAQKPNPKQCVYSIPKFNPILITSGVANTTYCSTQSYSFVADRTSANCQYVINPTEEQKAQLNIVYTRPLWLGDNTILIEMFTTSRTFQMLTRPTNGYCISNNTRFSATPPLRLPSDCNDPTLPGDPNWATPYNIGNFTNNQEIRIFNTAGTLFN